MHADIEQLADYTFSAVAEGYDAFLLRDLLRSSKQDILYIVSDGLSLERTAELLKNVAPDVEVLKFPAWDTVPYDRVSPNAGIVAERVAALGALTLNPNPKKKRIVVASIGAVVQKLPPSKIFRNSMREIRVGGKLDFNDFVHYAVVNGYNRVEQVMEPGEYAVRGDILDIFPVGTPEPLRIDLFDDEVEKIRTFDAFSQRTTGELKSYGFRWSARWCSITIPSRIFAPLIAKLSVPQRKATSFMRRFPPRANIWAWKTGCRFSMRSRCRACLIICRLLMSCLTAASTTLCWPRKTA